MRSNVLCFPSRGLSAGQQRHRGRQRPAPAGNVVEIVGLDLAVGEHEDALFRRAVGVAVPLLVTPDRAHRAPQLFGKLLLGEPFLITPICQFHNGTTRDNETLPKWLSYSLALWQYANMAKCQIVYIRGVANDDIAPNRIQELLDARGMKQAELARLANVTVSALNKVVKGTRGLDQEWMRRLAPHLGVSPAELLPWTENMILTQEERELLERYRAADRSTQDQLQRVSAAIIPFGHKPADAA